MTLKNWAISLEVSGAIRTSLGAEVQPEYFFKTCIVQIATRIIFGGYVWLTSENYGELRPENIYEC